MSPAIASAVRTSIVNGRRPLVIGGDHSCAIGTWSGVNAAVRERGTLGLLWIDAHLDSHTPQTSHTGLIYGMPLAALLGYGDPAFTDCAHPGPKLRPEHVCVLGARSYEPEERALLDRIGVRVIGMDEVRRLGQPAAFAQALAVVRRASAGYGITLDLDALDPRDAPGVGTPAVGGLRAGALIESLAAVGRCDRLVALEIAELNPGRDRAQRTLKHALAMAAATLGASDAETTRAVPAPKLLSCRRPTRASAR
jgi:arginase